MRERHLRVDDLLCDSTEIGSDDIRLWSEGKQHLARAGHERGGASRTQRSENVPRVCSNKAELRSRHAQRVGDKAIRLGRRLEALNTLD